MMAITVSNYGLFGQSLMEGRVNFNSDELWCMLVTSSYLFNQHTHKFKSVVNGEVAGSGYIPGGMKVNFAPPAYDSTTKTNKLVASNVVWPVVTWTGVVGAVLYVKPIGVTADGSMPLVSYISFGQTVNRTAQAFYLNMPTAGVFRLVNS